jgi:hypothetical protein
VRTRRYQLLLIAMLLAPSSAKAASVVSCGETVDRETATLSGSCTGSINVVAGTLKMEGFTITGTGLAAIQCQGRCRIIGPGSIVSGGSTFGITGDGSIRASDVQISGHEVAGVDAGELGRVRLDQVSVTSCGVGVSGPRIKLTDCEIDDNSSTGVLVTTRGAKLLRTQVRGNGGDGVSVTLNTPDANRATLILSSVSDNGHFGVIAKNVSTKNAFLRANSQADACGDTEPCSDVASVNSPRLNDTSCDTSMQVPAEFTGPIPFGVPWGVCSFD